jgi:pimeloyl-ACP methyl ester carboxylesterase
MLKALPLPDTIRSRQVAGVNGLSMHVLEAGQHGAPCIALLHGFPELAYSWRQLMPTLASAGYHVIAPDQRGYGRTTGWDDAYDTDVSPFRLLGLVDDLMALLKVIGVERLACLAGHDFGSPVAAWAALTRPHVVGAVVLMSAPFPGPPPAGWRHSSSDDLDKALAALDPPRRHYQNYFSTPEADADLRYASQGLESFLRGYFHEKSGDAAGPRPEALGRATAEAFARLPSYYVMERGKGMAETIAQAAPTALPPARWLSDEDLAVFASEFGRTGFQGGLNWYRAAADPELAAFAGRTIDIPATFIAGDRDWGVRQSPGAFEAMSARACTRFVETPLIAAAGHWVQQESPEAVSRAILAFLKRVS